MEQRGKPDRLEDRKDANPGRNADDMGEGSFTRSLGGGEDEPASSQAPKHVPVPGKSGTR